MLSWYRHQDHPNSSVHIFSVKKCQGLLNRIASCVLDDDQLLNLDPSLIRLSLAFQLDTMIFILYSVIMTVSGVRISMGVFRFDSLELLCDDFNCCFGHDLNVCGEILSNKLVLDEN